MKNKNKHPVQYDAVIDAPFGSVGITVQGLHVAIVLFSEKLEKKTTEYKIAHQVSTQIEAYFMNAYHSFNLPLIDKGTPFQRLVWQEISTIPCGQVVTYSDIAIRLGSGARAVANACGANTLPLVIPCHRVVAKNGLGGFMRGLENGLEIKKWLLKHEGALFQQGEQD